jgi:hypothetical protein
VTHTTLGPWGLGLLALAAVRCSNGTETDNPVGPVVAFQGSQCEHQGTSHDGAPPQSSTQSAGAYRSLADVPGGGTRLEIAGDYTRLECVAWERDGEKLRVSVRNFRASCGIEWGEGRVSVDGASVFLGAHNPECRVARCGNCFYDLEFAVEGVPQDGDLDVSIAETDGTKKICQPQFEPKIVSVANTEPSGVRCAPLTPTLFNEPPPDCERYSACSDACACASETRCETVATEFSSGTLCVPECTTEDDCPVPGAFTCEAGLCRSKPWTE